MVFRNYNYINYFNSIISEAEDCIKDNNMNSLKRLVEKFDVLGTATVFTDFSNYEPLYSTAIKNERDDMALLLYMANPSEVKAHMHKFNYHDFTIFTDILGCAVLNRRYKLVDSLLDLKGVYEFDIDGVKNTNNTLLNFYYVINHGKNSGLHFGLDEGDKFISSPLLISILIGDWDMYLLLKKKGAYFNKENKDCRFHLEQCTNPKILKDIEHSFE